MRPQGLALGALALCAVAGCGWGRSPANTATVPVVLEDVNRWVRESPLPKDRTILITELARTRTSSTHLVQIRGAEPLHVHKRHDLVVMVQRGRGTLQLGETSRPVGRGSVVVIPRGTPHAYVNASRRRPGVAIVVFSPPYDGKDQVPVDSAP